MAFDDTETQKVRDYLGLESLLTDSRYIFQTTRLEERLAALNAAAEARVKSLLAEIDTLRSDITAARGRLKAAELEGIKLNPKEIDQLWKEDLRLCRMLAQVISWPLKRHPALPVCAGVETL